MIDFIMRFKPAYDKTLHFMAGTLLAVSVCFIPFFASMVFVCGLGVIWEALQEWKRPGSANLPDWAWTVAGALPVWIAWGWAIRWGAK